MIEIIAFDADDTLWHFETVYRDAAAKFEKLLMTHYGLTSIDGEIYKTEKDNLRHFGYGVKSYTISMIETAVRLTDGRIEGRHIREIIAFGREMLDSELLLMDGAEEVVATLALSYPLMLITKGDQFEQERKIKRSGLASYFKQIEIGSEKTTESYSNLLAKYGIDPAGFVMVGNSLRSDILPVVALGGT
ncbi:MAG: HAD family hydrolase, partial [Candidatus Promineifilaceae bacterium]